MRKNEERMVTMIDEIYDRQYQHARRQMNAAIVVGLLRFGRAVGDAFAVLNRIEYSEPWTPRARKAGPH
jgi:hypothetical protein